MRRRLALLIGSTTFDHPTVFGNLRTPKNDVQDFARLLEACGNFETFDTLIDATAEIVKRRIEDLFTTVERGDLALLYYSGHGYKGRDGRHYLITKNSLPDRLQSTAVPEWYIQNVMHSSRSRHRIIILDCCFSGAFIEGQKSGVEPLLLEELRGEATAILTSSGRIQYSFEESGRNSLFTQYLLLGIETGEADEDKDGYVSIDELFYYAEPRVIERRPNQTPMIYLKLREDKKLVVARSSVQLQVTAPPSELPVILDRPAPPEKDILRPIWFAIGISTIALLLAMIAIFGPFVNDNLSLTPPAMVAPTQAPTQVPEVLASTDTEAPTPTPAPTNTPEPPTPTSIYTSTPTSTPTPTPTPAPSPTETAALAPTSTPLPTPSSVPTAVTTVLIPTATPPSLASPTPASLCAADTTSGQAEVAYPAPTLREPDNGTVYVGPTAEIVLAWDPIELQNGDAYVVTTIRHHDPDGYYCDYQFTRDTSIKVPAYIYADIEGGRDIDWYVAVIRNGDTTDEDGTTRLIGEILSPSSKRRTFVWNATGPGPDGPTPKPLPSQTQ